MKRSFHRGEKRGAPAPFVFAFLISLSSVIILSLCASVILLSSDDPLRYIPPISLLVFLSSAVISGAMTEKYAKGAGVRATVISSSALLLCTLIISIVANRAVSSPRLLMSALCYLPIAVLSALFVRSRTGRRKRR